ncbi:MAG: hypothetical protein ACI9H8_001583 [Lysobacterales bacterium]|jgi:hypothetical protein
MRVFFAILIGLSFSVSQSHAQEVVDTYPEPALDCEEALTVFQDVSGMGRKDKAARNMTKNHAEHAQDGWRFAGLAVYTENGDLEGFYLSYTRAVDCASIAKEED